MREIHYTELGATLFMPASHKNLKTVANKQKYKSLKSLVIDLEDGLNQRDLDSSMEIIRALLPIVESSNLYIFIRPRDITILKKLLLFDAIQNITGFILPKFSLKNAKEYLEVLKESNHYIMPSIEGEELFNPNELRELRDLINPYKKKVLLVRFGLEDMLRQLGLRRECGDSIFDLSACSVVLGNFIAIFKSSGYGVSGGVYPCFKDDEGFTKDIRRDLKEGLFSKTIIHPRQIDLANETYKVSKQELEEAKEIAEDTNVIFSQNNKMAEKNTMLPFSLEIIKRSEVYGIIQG